MAGRRSTPGLFELLQEADLSQFYNELRNSLKVFYVQQLKDVTEVELCSIGMNKIEAQRLKSLHNRYCPPNYVTKLKKLLLPTWTKDEFLLDDEASESVPSPPSTTSNLSMPLPETVVQHQGVEIKVPRQHLINPDAIQIYKELGTGEFGVVQQGVWIDEDQETHQVAIKSLSKERMQNSTMEFMKEYEIMQTIQHENIVRLFGVVLDSSRIMIITELAQLRSLLECLKEPNLRSTLTVSCLASFAQQICSGMKYLESRRLIHRDLAARNILVFSKDLVKISDFGLSRALGVGKDYYQTNFNMNLKLPIAWCAPECITFLKFTSASDIWAFGVTMWEMFSYGFQPWAAQTGQQILEAIDEPKSQRLERPRHCPLDLYNVMLQCWKHEPHLRPTFTQLCSILNEAKPEQVRATVPSPKGTPGLLEFEVGHVITVLDKSMTGMTNMWSGVRDDNSHIGLFLPTQVITYLNTVPKILSSSSSPNQIHEKNQPSNSKSSFSIFNTTSLRRDSKKRWSNHENICQHRSQSSIDETSRLILPSETSDMAPLISSPSSTTSTPQKPVNRMGHTIGYIRDKKSSNHPTFGVSSMSKNKTESKPEKHEYHSISDNEENGDELDAFSKPLDLGPSLLDEVFKELDHPGGDHNMADINKKSDNNKKDLKEIVSSTLHIRRHKKKQLATVRPIKASDEKVLESAIAMANALASKSMHDIDKKSMDHFYDQSPGRSPITPNSPAKKFSFFFPGTGNKSPKMERKPFSEAAGTSKDITSCLSDQEKDAYRALVGESESLPPLTKLVSSPTMSQSLACIPTSWNEQPDHFLQLSPPPSIPAPPCPQYTDTTVQQSTVQTAANIPTAGNTTLLRNQFHEKNQNNPLPLPPKKHSLNSQHPPKRHVRKNPLIVPSAMVSNMIRNENVPMNLYGSSGGASGANISSRTSVGGNSSNLNTNNVMPNYADILPMDDAFENAIAKDIDALDTITSSFEGAEESLFMDDLQNKDKSDSNCDEVRIMMKVMGRCAEAEQCLLALNLTNWSIHHAIKFVKLKNLIKVQHVSDQDLLETLETEAWDVAKAAGHIMKHLQ